MLELQTTPAQSHQVAPIDSIKCHQMVKRVPAPLIEYPDTRFRPAAPHLALHVSSVFANQETTFARNWHQTPCSGYR